MVALFKIDGYAQKTLSPQPNGSAIGAIVEFKASPAAPATVSLVGPTRSIALLRQADGSFRGEQDFPTTAALDAAYPDGLYAIVVVGSPGSNTSIPVTFGAPAITPPYIINFPDLQSWPDAHPWLWTSGASPSFQDIISVDVFTPDGDDVSSLTPNGQSNVFDLTSGTDLPSGIPLTCDLYVIPTTYSTPNGGVTAVATGRGYWIEFPLECDPRPPTLNRATSVVARRGSAPVLAIVGAFPDSREQLTVKWYKDGVLIPDTTFHQSALQALVHSLNNVQPSDAGAYQLSVTDEGGTSLSAPIWMAVSPALSTTQVAGGQYGNVDGPALSARFHQPNRIASDGLGNLYITDAEDFTVRKLTASGDVSTLAGLAGQSGTADGLGSAARFSGFSGIAADAAGNVYVTDTALTLRQIDAGGNVRTLAGFPNAAGLVDGGPGVSRFYSPQGLAIGPDGAIYVGDYTGIRRVTPSGLVSTLAGSTNLGPVDGLAFDRSANLYAGVNGNSLVRLSPAGVATTIIPAPPTYYPARGGLATSAYVDGSTSLAFDPAGNLFICGRDVIQMLSPQGVVTNLTASGGYAMSGLTIDNAGAIFLAGGLNAAIFKGSLSQGSGPEIAITVAPRSEVVSPGSSAALSVVATGPELTYQWLRDGVPIPGATSDTFLLNSTTAKDLGAYSVEIGNGAGLVTSGTAALGFGSTADPGRILNLSVLATAGTAAGPLTVGFSVGGAAGATKPLLVRGIGPTLASFKVSGVLPHPVISLFSSASQTLTSNSQWAGDPTLSSAFARVGAFALPMGSLDSAFAQSLLPGNYTVQLTSADVADGRALAEVYDLDAAADSATRLQNISVRTRAGSGDKVLTAGFIIGGSTAKTVLIRGIGPALNYFQVANCLTSPVLTVFDSQTNVVAFNQGWAADGSLEALFSRVGAFSLLGLSTDCALVTTLAPGAYTAQVTSADGTVGQALIEVYAVP